MGVLFDRWRIDPADVAVRAAVNQIDATVSGVTEHEDRRARHIEFQHRFADRKTLEGCCRLGNDGWMVLRWILVGRSAGNQRGRCVDSASIDTAAPGVQPNSGIRVPAHDPSLGTPPRKWIANHADLADSPHSRDSRSKTRGAMPNEESRAGAPTKWIMPPAAPPASAAAAC